MHMTGVSLYIGARGGIAKSGNNLLCHCERSEAISIFLFLCPALKEQGRAFKSFRAYL